MARSAQLRFKNLATAKSDEHGTPHAPLRTAGLFAGIGGIELGLSKAGHTTELLCEIDERANAVLDAHFAGIPRHADVSTLKSLPSGTELLSAGFPCQDLSQAGTTKGIEGDRSGLVGHVFRLVRRRRVDWVLIENVPFMLQLGSGRAMEVIVSEFEQLGYRWAYRVVDSRAFGLPQRRERVFYLASRVGDPRDVLFADDSEEVATPEPSPNRSTGFYWTEGVRGLGLAVDAVPTLKGGSSIGIPSPPAVMLRNGRVVTPDITVAERLQGFEAEWTKPAEAIGARIGHRWKLVGNAVTVDVAEWVGRRLIQPGKFGCSWADSRLPVGAPWPRAAWGERRARYAAPLSTFPVRKPMTPISDFMPRDARRDLSVRAATGFLARLRTGSLRMRDQAWFVERLERHIERVQARST